MEDILVVDASSIFIFNKYYNFDKDYDKDVYHKLNNFLLSEITNNKIIIIDKVYDEIRTNRFTEKLKEKIKPYKIDTFFLFEEVEELIRTNTRADIIELFQYSTSEVESQLLEYQEKYADLYLIAYCNYLKDKGFRPILVTEETFTDDKKIVYKIPTICRNENIRFEKIFQILFNFYKDKLKFKLEIT